MAESNTTNTLTGYGLAKKLGISKQSVYQAITAGRLVVVDKKIDLDNELTKEFIKYHGASAKAAGDNGRGRPIQNGNAPPVDFSGAEALLNKQKSDAEGVQASPPAQGKALANIVDQSRQMDVTLKRIKAAKEQVFYHELIKKVVPFEVTARLFNIVSSSIEQEFRNFDQQHTGLIVEAVIDAVGLKLSKHAFGEDEKKVADKIIAILKEGIEKTPVATIIREEIERGIQAVRRTSHLAIEQLREGESK